MPELPEVESIRRGLVPHLVGNTVVGVVVKKPKLVSGRGNVRIADEKKARDFERILKGRKIADVTRRAKMLGIVFDSGVVVGVHLKMSGQLVYQREHEPPVWGGHPIRETQVSLPHKHTHIIFTLQKGMLYYNDQRMFGYMLVFPDIAAWQADSHSQGLGYEPFDTAFTLQIFTDFIRQKSQSIKSIFLSQSIVVGLGNIYADEVCFAAGVLPQRSGKSLRLEECTKLYEAILRILPRAIELGGSSVANYLLADGSRGNYAREHKVYGQAGKPCSNCGQILQKTTIASRTTVYCRNCQV